MILNHSVKQKEVLCPYCAFPLWYLEHSRDICNTSYCFMEFNLLNEVNVGSQLHKGG